MSLDVYIKYREPKMVNYNKTHASCGSTMRVCEDDSEYQEEEWSANITHNMGRMADVVPVGDGLSLYDVVWRPDEHDISTTDELVERLRSGIDYMITNRKELLKYNPKNGWGDYDSFVSWSLNYLYACIDNPGCEIYVSR